MKNSIKKHIFLTGFMGAGKSRIGKQLAKRFACSFFDSDKLIENEAGKTIKEIFETNGEAYFRRLETGVIQELCDYEKQVIIALGGGANINPVNAVLIRQNGISVYLKSSPQAIFERVKHSDKRPLLKTEQDENFEHNLMEKIETLLKERSPVYETADIVFERDGLDAEEIVEQLFHSITEFREKNNAKNKCGNKA